MPRRARVRSYGDVELIGVASSAACRWLRPLHPGPKPAPTRRSAPGRDRALSGMPRRARVRSYGDVELIGVASSAACRWLRPLRPGPKPAPTRRSAPGRDRALSGMPRRARVRSYGDVELTGVASSDACRWLRPLRPGPKPAPTRRSAPGRDRALSGMPRRARVRSYGDVELTGVASSDACRWLRPLRPGPKPAPTRRSAPGRDGR
ncbi:hypothetical protein CFBP6600_14400 [Xanthomonas arboricola pv. corylina]|nr:hypothetical protein CFBP6600_14400 [Xanthomonas arboricola pv. corylina]CAE6741717.1 hypothetical protein CFBP6600_14400 [Xanthomonas arboricola pv. corylina]